MKTSHHDTGIPKDIYTDWRIAIIHATYYKEEIGVMVASAMATLTKAGIPEKNILLFRPVHLS